MCFSLHAVVNALLMIAKQKAKSKGKLNKSEISRFYGIIIYMYMSEHNPPHFHVWYENYKAIITIKDGTLRRLSSYKFINFC